MKIFRTNRRRGAASSGKRSDPPLVSTILQRFWANVAKPEAMKRIGSAGITSGNERQEKRVVEPHSGRLWASGPLGPYVYFHLSRAKRSSSKLLFQRIAVTLHAESLSSAVRSAD
jgi:hypothetical protein